MTVSELLDALLKERILEQVTKGTHFDCLRKIIRCFGKDPPVEELFTKAGILRYRTWLIETPLMKPVLTTRRRMPSTINHMLYVVMDWWTYAADEDIVDYRPPSYRKILVPAPRQIPTAWTLDEFRKIIRSLRHMKQERYWNKRHFACLLLVLYYTGQRISATIALKLEDQSDNMLTFRWQNDKKRKEKVRRIPRFLVRLLASLRRRPGDDRLIPTKKNTDLLYEQMKRVLIKAGLPHTNRDMFHKIRRSAATQIARNRTLEAARIFLDHSSVKVTRDYVDPRQIQDKVLRMPLVKLMGNPLE